MSRFIETIRVENQKAFLLDLHQKRMNEIFAAFEKENPYQLEELFAKENHDEKGLYKWRIVYDTDGNLQTQLIPYAVEIPDDFELVNGKGIDYHFKYEDRSKINLLKQHANADEVIIYKGGCITDTSYSNLIFLKDEKWYTPTTFLLNGVMRQHLLAKRQISEAEISLENIHDFSHFQLINAMIPFGTQIYSIEKISNLFQVKTLEM